MCGYICLWKIDNPNLAHRMIDRIAHRGPDDLRVSRAPNAPVVMAHCRLAIIGPENGIQPIYNNEDALVANGEIYNHADLRAILGESAFETQSDSETILHLFRSEEVRWIAKLDGMFSFVLATPDRIIAARDPLGIKPLFMARLGEGLAFASELKAFNGLGFHAVEAIEPGTMFDSLNGCRAWYRMPQGAAELLPGEKPESIRDELRLVLEAAVRKWMVADVEVGAFLSGGLDSSVIAALATDAIDRPLKTFSVGVAGSADLVAARAVADHIGSDHHELVYSVDDLVDALPHVIYHLESCRRGSRAQCVANPFRDHTRSPAREGGADGRRSRRALCGVCLPSSLRRRATRVGRRNHHVRSGPCTTPTCNGWTGSPWPRAWRRVLRSSTRTSSISPSRFRLR